MDSLSGSEKTRTSNANDQGNPDDAAWFIWLSTCFTHSIQPRLPRLDNRCTAEGLVYLVYPGPPR